MHPGQDKGMDSHSVEMSLDSVGIDTRGTLEVGSPVACSLEDEWHPVWHIHHLEVAWHTLVRPPLGPG